MYPNPFIYTFIFIALLCGGTALFVSVMVINLYIAKPFRTLLARRTTPRIDEFRHGVRIPPVIMR